MDYVIQRLTACWKNKSAMTTKIMHAKKAIEKLKQKPFLKSRCFESVKVLKEQLW